MKKFISLFLTVLMMLSAVPSAMSSDLPIMVKVNGIAVAGTENTYIDGDNIMIPLRTVSQALGSKVTWLEESRSALVTFMDKRAIVPIYGNTFYIDDTAAKLKNDIVIKDGVTFISSDYINLFFDYVTQWNELAKILTINPDESYQESLVVENEEDKGYIDVVATHDAYVKNGSFAGQNFGSASALEYKAETLADYGRIIYLKFDLSQIKDTEFLSADLQLTAYSCEAGAKISPVIYNLSETDTNWKETEITYNNKPLPTEKVGQFSEIYNPLTEFELTDYIKKKISEGTKEISFMLDGDYSQKLRVDFYSKEKVDQLPPRLRITYVESDSFVKDLPKKENFGENKDPWEWAQTMISQSTAERTKLSEDGLIKQTTQNKFEILAKDTTYTNSGTMANDNFADSQTIMIKGDPATTNTGRVSYLKFDLSQADFETVDYAYIKLYCTTLDTGNSHKVALYEVVDDWSADAVTWNNAPTKGALISKGEVVKTSDWIFLDATEYLKKCISKGKKTVSFALEDKSGVRAVFASKKSSYGPVLSVRTLDGGAQPIEIIKDDLSEYTLKTEAKTDNGKYVAYDTRMFETLPGIDISSKKPVYSRYGGRTDMKEEATGSFYVTQKDGRYWFVDPDGNLFYSIGIVSLVNGGSTKLAENSIRIFGSTKNWAEKTTDILRNDLYFNTAGAWSDTKNLSETENAMGIAVYDAFLVNYASTMGLYTGNTAANNKFTENNTMSVFDPDFEKFADNEAKTLALQYKDNPRILGFMSDNELPHDTDMLISYLNLNPENPLNAFSYATAWSWVCNYTGKENPEIDDVTDVMKADFVDFVYDRYYSVIDAALEKYMPEKLYLGSRYCFNNYKNKPAMAAAGRYCDVVSINYYHAWTPDSFLMADWYEWSKKPVMITEWYAMGDDSGLPNEGGAGWKVETQKDRGRFYQNYALKLLENKNCVGFHWFKYLDNDASTTQKSDPHSSNKGILNGDFELWTDLTDEATKVNRQVYELIDYFDRRNQN